MKNLTCNQLLEKFGDIKINSMTPELSKIREQLIEFKRSHIKGGLMEIENSKTIVDIINRI